MGSLLAKNNFFPIKNKQYLNLMKPLDLTITLPDDVNTTVETKNPDGDGGRGY